MKKRFSFGLVLAAVGLACSSPTAGDLGEGLVASGAPADAVELVAASPSPEPETTPAAALAPLASQVVFHSGGRPYLVLDEAPNLALAVDAPALVGDVKDGVVAVSRQVDPARLAKEHAAKMGSRVQLRGAGGRVCEAIVEGISFVGRVAPSGETELLWTGQARDDEDAPVAAPPRAAIAEEAWDMADGSVVLAAALRPIGNCDAATYALADTQARAGEVAEADDTTARAALTALRATPEYARHAAEYVDYAREMEGAQTAARWDEHAEGAPRISAVKVGEVRYVFVSAGTAAGCGDFGAELSALFRETDGGLEVVRMLDGFTGTLEGIVDTGAGPELVC